MNNPSTTVDTCSEWMLGQLSSLAKGQSKIWLRDPDRLLPCEIKEIQRSLKLEHQIIVARHSIGLRHQLREGLAHKWILIEQTRSDKPEFGLFAPDLQRLLRSQGIFQRTIRDYFVHLSNDQSWPQDVESFPYRELARDNPVSFLRAYEDFRARKPNGFSSEDLLLIGASAVLQQNVFALNNPFSVLELAFHSEERWSQLNTYFGTEEVQAVSNYLSRLRSPMGALFGNQRQSARLACVALLVLSRHVDSPASFLPNLSPSLTAWQNCEPIETSALPPTWFQTEVELFDKAVSDAFLKIMRQALGLNDKSSAKAFADSGCWSRKLRELVVLDVGKPIVARKGSAELTATGRLEGLVPEFRAVLSQVQKLVATLQPACDRLRVALPSNTKMEQVLKVFRDLELYRVPVLIGKLSDLSASVTGVEDKPVGFDEKWEPFRAEADKAIRGCQELLEDYDYILGRYFEAEYSKVVPDQILPTNLLIQKVIAPEKVNAPKGSMALIVLDGLRYDLWREIIRPHLERRYQVEERIAVSMLPSETRISRFGFFSGLKPKDFFEKPLPGGEPAACNRLLQHLVPGHPELVQWEIRYGHSVFTFATKDNKTFIAVLDFADALGHANVWDIDFLAKMVELWLSKFDQLIALLPKSCELWITADHGQIVSGGSVIDIPQDLLVKGGNSYRAALLKQKLYGQHANHCFYIKAKDLGYEQEGFWAFPKPGYSFRLQAKEAGEKARFKPLENMRHGGLSAFEIFVPLARLKRRTTEVRVRLAPMVTGVFKVGVPAAILVEVSSDSPVLGQLEIGCDIDGAEPTSVSNVGPSAQLVRIPFTPAKPGLVTMNIEARWGFRPVPSPAQLTIQVEGQISRPEDALDAKLKNLLG